MKTPFERTHSLVTGFVFNKKKTRRIKEGKKMAMTKLYYSLFLIIFVNAKNIIPIAFAEAVIKSSIILKNIYEQFSTFPGNVNSSCLYY